jgi:hypothetical protein
MNQGKSALNAFPTPCPACQKHKLSNCSLHALHNLAIAWCPSPHSCTKTNIPPASTLILHHNTTTALASCFALFVYCYTLWVRHLSLLLWCAFARCFCTRSRSHLYNHVPRALLSTRICRLRVHVVRFCHTSCSTRHYRGHGDWLTCRISSTATSFAIGIGQPFLFGARMHRSYWCACTS